MAITLYDATVAGFIQTMGSVDGFLKQGRKFCDDGSVDLKSMLDAQLFPNMLPLRYQVQAAIGHSVGAIDGVRAGVFKPPYGTPTADWDALQTAVTEAIAALTAWTREEVNALEQRDVIFNLGDRQMPFTGEGFLLTFSVPNLHFHATTAYDILRSKGVPLGKRDYLGRIRLKT